MERVTFIVEESGEQLACLLNPESVTLRRRSGVRRRRLGGRTVTGRSPADDTLLYTGGGRTELHLDLLFDVSVSGSTLETENVRDLTGPLWDLAENAREAAGPERGEGRGGIPRVRFVWGKTWNIPGVVAGVAERLEQFDREGVPRRSWVRMRLLRVSGGHRNRDRPEAPRPPLRIEEGSRERGVGETTIHSVIGGGPDGVEGSGPTERLDEIAHRYYGNPAFWRVLALYNGVSDPLRLSPGDSLEIPPPSVVEGP